MNKPSFSNDELSIQIDLLKSELEKKKGSRNRAFTVVDEAADKYLSALIELRERRSYPRDEMLFGKAGGPG